MAAKSTTFDNDLLKPIFNATASATGAAVSNQVGSASGLATAAAVGASTASSVGASDGVATAAAISGSAGSAVGSADGSATASAVGQAVIYGAGSASGAATASATGAAVANSVGSAAGAATASGIGAATARSVGSAAGTSTATAIGLVVAVGAGFRDWDVLEAIRDLVIGTNAFDGVYLGDLPSRRGQPSSELKVAIIEATRWVEDDLRDDVDTYEVQIFSEFAVTILVRDDDPVKRDRECDRLQNVVRNAVNNRTLVSDGCFPGLTRMARGRPMASQGCERRFVLSGQYSYSIFGEDNGPTGHDESP